MIVVSNTTPLHYLILIDRVDVLGELFGRIVIPRAAYIELTRERAPGKVRTWLIDRPYWIDVQEIEEIDPAMKAGAGEREAIALAERLQADLLLLDDRIARRTAKERGIIVTGTLGVLEVAARRGMTRLPDAIALLRRTNFHASESLLQDFLERNVGYEP